MPTHALIFDNSKKEIPLEMLNINFLTFVELNTLTKSCKLIE